MFIKGRKFDLKLRGRKVDLKLRCLTDWRGAPNLFGTEDSVNCFVYLLLFFIDGRKIDLKTEGT